jgi:uncharacterized membrane protein
MPEEIRRETTEDVVSNEAPPEPATMTDPVTGEVLTTRSAERAVASDAGAVASSHQQSSYVDDPYAARRLRAYRLQQVIYLIFGIIEGLIAIRFVLEVLGANPSAGFAQFIYGITGIFMAPFVGLFGQPRFGTSVVEWSALVAIVVYALIGWVLGRLVWIGAGDTRTAVVSRTERVDTHRDNRL